MFLVSGQISILELRDWLKEKRKAYLFDLRDSDDFKKNSIKYFQNIPAAKISKLISQIDPENTVLLLCQDGQASVKAQKIFSSCGIQSYVIRGGFNDWQKVFG